MSNDISALPIEGVLRKRPIVDLPVVSGVPAPGDNGLGENAKIVEGTTPLKVYSCGDKSFTPNNGSDANVRVSFCYEEMRQIWRILSTVNNRYIRMNNAHQALNQDYGYLQGHLVQVERELDEERQATTRAYQSVEELRLLGINLTERVIKLSQLKKLVEEKAAESASLIASLRDVQTRLESKLQALLADKDKLDKDLGDLQSKMELERQEMKVQTDELRLEIENKDREIGQIRDNLAEYQGKLQRLEGDLVELENSKKEQVEDYHAKFIGELGNLVSLLAKKFNCLPPASFGDGGIEAFAVVIEEFGVELEQKMAQITRDNEQKSMSMVQKIGEIDNELQKARVQLDEHQNEKEEQNSRTRELQTEIAKHKGYITKLEGRIHEMQLDSSKAAVKLAEIQSLRLLGDVVAEVLEFQQSKMEYEDIKSEKLSHGECQTNILKLTEALQQEREQAERQETILETLRLELEAKDKSYREEIKSLTMQLESVKKASVSTPKTFHHDVGRGKGGPFDVSRDNTIDGLIQLMEKDTQELKAMQSTRISINTVTSVNTPSSGTAKKRGKSTTTAATAAAAVTHTASKRSRRHPSTPSNQSEADLWSVFRKP